MPNNLTAEEVFRLIAIDRKRKVKTSVELKDSEEDEIPIKEVVEELVQYINDKLADDEANICKTQILPLMVQAATIGLAKYLDKQSAAFLLADPVMRDSLIQMMGLSFYLLKWMQQKRIKIYTLEEQVTEEEIASLDRCSRASDLVARYAKSGGNPKVAMREMLKRGLLKEEDLEHLGAEDLTEETIAQEDTDKN